MNNINRYKNQDFTSHKAMSEAFFNLTQPLWDDIPNNDVFIESEDLSAILEVQATLLKEVIKIHEAERQVPDSTKKIISEHLNISTLRDQLNGAFSCHNIYYMDQDCDYYFVGDIHSDAYIFDAILKHSRFFQRVSNKENFKIIFLGDYVDRGKNHIRTVETLLLLKYLFPEHIYLLMGNHDIGNIENGEVTLYLRKAEEEKDYFYYYINDLHQNHKDFSDELLDLYLKFMNNLNVTAYVITAKNTIMAVHGGIPRPDEQDQFNYIKSHEQLTDDTIDHMNFRIRDCIIWSDPSIQDNKPTMENRRFKFYENQLINFHDTFGFDTLIRGHQAMEDGCVSLFDNRLYTIFSSGIVLKDDENINLDTAYDFVTPKILQYNHQNGLPMIVHDLNSKLD